VQLQFPKLASNFVYATSFQGLSLVTQTCGVVWFIKIAALYNTSQYTRHCFISLVAFTYQQYLIPFKQSLAKWVHCCAVLCSYCPAPHMPQSPLCPPSPPYTPHPLPCDMHNCELPFESRIRCPPTLQWSIPSLVLSELGTNYWFCCNCATWQICTHSYFILAVHVIWPWVQLSTSWRLCSFCDVFHFSHVKHINCDVFAQMWCFTTCDA